MDAWLCCFARSPFTPAHKGGLKNVRPDEIAGQVIRAAIERSGIPSDKIDDMMVGCAYPEGEQGLNIGRILTYLSGSPVSVPGMTTNRLCGSSMQVVHTAAGLIARGWGDLFICAGVESMSRVQRGGFNRSLHPGLEEKFPDAYISMGMTAENVAVQFGIERLRQEQFSLESHQKADTANRQKRFSSNIVVIEHDGDTISDDGCIRRQTTVEAMQKLKPAFVENGTVTAATSSPLTDGAVCLVVASDRAVGMYGLERIAKIHSAAVTGCPPSKMGLGPIDATRLVLARAGLELNDIGVIELNEAFSSQSLAVIDELGFDLSKVNIDGGALAIGHPLGASGARIIGRSAEIMRRIGVKYALSTMCIGGGMGIATILENPH